MLRVSQQDRDRLRSAAGVAALHALLAYALLRGFGIDLPVPVPEEMKIFDVSEPPPPPAIPAPPEKVRESKRAKPKDPEGAAAPPNLKDTPTEIVAPPPRIVLPVPPPIPAAPVGGQGDAPAAGAAEVPGPGTGRGGRGTGLGSGAQGTGTGGGGGGIGSGRPVHARWIRGGIDPDDYPRSALRRRASGVVRLRFTVAPDGRVRDCAVTGSSGDAELDRTTCRLIEQRFHYRPARDAAGRPVAETVRGEHEWELGAEPPPVEVEPDIVDE
jgi:protein TonB